LSFRVVDAAAVAVAGTAHAIGAYAPADDEHHSGLLAA